MSAAPDPAELAPSRDPAAYGRRPLFTSGLLVWVLLCLACLLIGGVVGRFGFPAEPSPRTDTAAAPDLTPRSASVAPAATANAPIGVPPTGGAPPASGGADAALSERVARLETAASTQDEAAAEALAASTLSVAAEGAAPFDRDLAAFERLAPDDPDVRALAPLAVRGAPSRAALAAMLPDVATAAVVAVRAPARNAGFLAKLWALIGRVVIVRKVDPAGPGVDGALAQAQLQAAAGDLEGAVRTLQRLPPAAQAQLAEWTAQANRRIEIDQRIAAIRARALAALTQPGAAQAAPGPGARS